MKNFYLQGIDDAKKQKSHDQHQNDVFKEVAESNLNYFVCDVKRNLESYLYDKKHLIQHVLNEEEVRQLAINFFTTQLSKKLNENVVFYSELKLTNRR